MARWAEDYPITHQPAPQIFIAGTYPIRQMALGNGQSLHFSRELDPSPPIVLAGGGGWYDENKLEVRALLALRQLASLAECLSEDDLKSHQKRILVPKQSLGAGAESDRIIEPGMLPIELSSHPFIQIPVKAEGQLGGAGAVAYGIGQPDG
jgi:hypothetical protein